MFAENPSLPARLLKLPTKCQNTKIKQVLPLCQRKDVQNRQWQSIMCPWCSNCQFFGHDVSKSTSSATLCLLQLSGDPRRPQDVQKYVPPVAAEDSPGDFRLVGSMLFGLAAMLTKVPPLTPKTPPLLPALCKACMRPND
jgi:hypothetical protein